MDAATLGLPANPPSQDPAENQPEGDTTTETTTKKDKETVIAEARMSFIKGVLHRYFKFVEKPKTKSQYVQFFENSAFVKNREAVLHQKHGFYRCGLYYCAGSCVIPYNAGSAAHVTKDTVPYPHPDAKLAMEAFSETCGN